MRLLVKVQQIIKSKKYTLDLQSYAIPHLNIILTMALSLVTVAVLKLKHSMGQYMEKKIALSYITYALYLCMMMED